VRALKVANLHDRIFAPLDKRMSLQQGLRPRRPDRSGLPGPVRGAEPRWPSVLATVAHPEMSRNEVPFGAGGQASNKSFCSLVLARP
jgi:hypothetical protein